MLFRFRVSRFVSVGVRPRLRATPSTGWIGYGILMAILLLSGAWGWAALLAVVGGAMWLNRANLTGEIRAVIETAVEKHGPTLARKRQTMITVDDYGVAHTKLWQAEVMHFGQAIIIPALPSGWADHLNKRMSLFDEVEAMVTKIIVPVTDFSPHMDPLDYEQLCADLVERSGWTARLTKRSGDQGADVIAERDGLKLVLQCKRYGQPVGNGAVQEALGAKHFERANFVAVVTNASFTTSARHLAATCGVDLLHHDQLRDYAADLASSAGPTIEGRATAI